MKDVETRSYGINLILKKYAKFPWYFPLPCHTEHGWTALPNALKSDLAVNKRLMFVFSKRRKDAWKKESAIPVEIMGSPFILYKNMKKLKKRKDAKGTVVFPSHSTYDLHAEFNVEELANQLKMLPQKYKPITICLFWIDYIEKAKQYRKRGFKVVSAGPKFTNSLKFVRNFYKILSKHKFACSNEIGSYTFYAVDFKLPFFLIGEYPEVINMNNKDINIGSSARLVDYEIGRVATKMFSTGPQDKISSKQKEFVESEMGIGECLTPEEMNNVLWKTFKKERYFKKLFLPYIFYSVFNVILFNMPWTGLVIYIRNRLKVK